MSNEEKLANIASALEQLAKSMDNLAKSIQYTHDTGKNSLTGALNNLASCIGAGLGSSLSLSIQGLTKTLEENK